MPSYYLYQCDKCDEQELRYRNVRRCRCGGNLTRVKDEGDNMNINEDAYEGLRQAAPEELLKAVIWFLRHSNVSSAAAEETIIFLCQGFQLARPDGWQHVAPIWLRESRKLAALDG